MTAVTTPRSIPSFGSLRPVPFSRHSIPALAAILTASLGMVLGLALAVLAVALPACALASPPPPNMMGSVRLGFGCPASPNCADTVKVHVQPGNLTGKRGAIFIALAPMNEQGPGMPAAFLRADGTIHVTASQPPAYHEGTLGTLRTDSRIRGGVCAQAFQHGAGGRIGLVVGIGLAPETPGLTAEDRAMLAQMPAADRAELERAFAAVDAKQPLTVAAWQDVMQQRRFKAVATVTCPPLPNRP